MANPSLKAKIEAAKSALKKDQDNTPINQGRDDSRTPETAVKTLAKSEPTSPKIVEVLTSPEPDASTLDARIKSLESKLAENQRDLHTLLGKIREVTRLQNGDAKSIVTKNTRPKDNSADDQTATRKQGRRIAVILAVLTGIILGACFFLAADFIDPLLVYPRTQAIQFVDFIRDIVR
ncbi:MAG: hypothetical protein ACJ0BO_04770 [Candidatus Puniceispirillaceae bacterium]